MVDRVRRVLQVNSARVVLCHRRVRVTRVLRQEALSSHSVNATVDTRAPWLVDKWLVEGRAPCVRPIRSVKGVRWIIVL